VKASILISNFNKDKFLNKCVQSCLDQSYQNIEIIVFDDKSSDNSIKILNKFNKYIKIIKNKIKFSNYDALNQINATREAFKKSTGDVIFLLDSDDYFSKNKVKKVVEYFIKFKSSLFVQDTPYGIKIKSKQKIKLKKINKTIFFPRWPFFFPTSTMCIKRNAFRKFLKVINPKKFELLEIDARLVIFAKYVLKDFTILPNNLTYYRFNNQGISSMSKKYTKNWWIKRNQAHQYVKYILGKIKINYLKGPDYYLTKLINYLY